MARSAANRHGIVKKFHSIWRVVTQFTARPRHCVFVTICQLQLLMLLLPPGSSLDGRGGLVMVVVLVVVVMVMVVVVVRMGRVPPLNGRGTCAVGKK